ncbi:NAD-dependent epimerase/dehydratase family protein [Sphingopyxis granuli]|uniref:NAD-dependent epimerase/dehydratase family protein n=1 Tax=Sphingopyxis granuli TaxID=267128 RepID=UPI001BAE908A|nr:NAD-dependent epimerase/dehydratase family protein [Sphingopyxis granuli]QUM71308.1 sugar nucleotide-binding protein [Sphingopyxis granuli]
MARDRILVVGANGALGQALLHELGPMRAIAATRPGRTALSGFAHVELDSDGLPPVGALADCRAVINAAGMVRGTGAELEAANVALPQRIAQAAKAAGVQKLVQVSSFAIHGIAEHIDGDAAEAPINAYGRTKATADALLLAQAADDFAVECLRLPFMFSTTKPALLGPLLMLASRLRVLPTASYPPVQRSMISYAGAARQLVDCARTAASGKAFAADPLLFDYRLLASVLGEEAGLKVRLLPVPAPIVAGVNRLLPAVGRRLFRSSILDARLNRGDGETLGLEEELRQLVRNRFGRH